MKNPKFLIFVFFVLLLASCTVENNPTDLPATEAISPITDSIQYNTAFKAYEAAYNQALIWNPKSELYTIPIKTLMATNLGIPPSSQGWYFMFKEKESPLELYVEVINGKVTGFTEAQPILVEELPYTLNPISLEDLIDSNEVFSLASNELPNQNLDNIELSLVFIKGNENPTWIVYLIDEGNKAEAIIFIDALTGKTTNDPYSK